MEQQPMPFWNTRNSSKNCNKPATHPPIVVESAELPEPDTVIESQSVEEHVDDESEPSSRQ